MTELNILSGAIAVGSIVTSNHTDKRTCLPVTVRPCRGGRGADFKTDDGALAKCRTHSQWKGRNEAIKYLHVVFD